VAIAVLAAALVVAGCGSSKKKSESSGAGKSGAVGANLDVTITESGKAAKYTVPKSTRGGLATLTATNKGKAPHSAQLVRIVGNHSAAEALKVVASDSKKTPQWVRAEGGLGAVAPNQSANASLKLDPGKYIVADTNGPGGGPPGYAEFTVGGATPGSLPTTSTTVTADETGKDKWRWDISGGLKSGQQDITFASKGKNTFHLIVAFKIKGKAPSQDELIKGLKSGGNGPPPKFVDTSSFTSTAVLDGGKSQTTPLELKGPGKWVLFCPVTDRDGGKEHFLEGLVKQVDVK
jgi:hypothetical protein